MRRDIFVSYRREDSAGEAGRLFDDLVREFGEESVFMDVDGIGPGMDFRKAIEENVSSCGVFLAVIGPEWETIADAQGAKRLENANDFVRLEIATALARNIAVIPVLVHGARMPRPEALPENLKDFAYRNSVEISHGHWNSDVALLLKALTQYVSTTRATATEPVHATLPVQLPPPVSHGTDAGAKGSKLPLLLGVGAAVVVVLGVVGYLVTRGALVSGSVSQQGGATNVAVGGARQGDPVAGAPIAGTQATVSLAAVANALGLSMRGVKFEGAGIDDSGWAYPARALGTAVAYNGVTYAMGAANQTDVVRGSAEVKIALPPGRFARLMLLGTAVNGEQPTVPFGIVYADGTQGQAVQGMSDWAVPQVNPGEVVVKQVGTRNRNDGTEQAGPFYLYGYTLPLDQSKAVSALIVPANPSVVIVAVTLAN